MAEQIQGIKRRIRSIGSTERITNAMKLVSAAKLRRAKLVYEHSNLCLSRITASIEEAFENAEVVPRQYLLGSREIKKTAYIIITSSTGLCGSFNGNVIRRTEEEIAASGHIPELITIGSKGREYFERRNVDILVSHDATADTVTYEETKSIAEKLVKQYLDGVIDEIVLIYTSYINTLKQEVVTKRILPIDLGEHAANSTKINSVEYEPSPQEVFVYLCEKLFEMRLYTAVIESATCEHAARRQAMENANDNAADMLSLLQLEYNRARQSQITDEIIEIVSGSEALS